MCTANFIITRVNILEKLIKTNKKEDNAPQFSPVFRRPNQNFQKIQLQVKTYYNCFQQPQLSFSFQFDEDPFIQFAFSYPYSYEDCQKLIESFQNKFINHNSIYFHNQVLTETLEKRKVRLITITEKQNCLKTREDKIQNLFPEQKSRPFDVNKPVILMSARVHPGQSPSSFAIEGALRFILNQRDCRSYLLRKNFLIKIIPMLNPDGVYHGLFRTDMHGENLNRIYLECRKDKHPSIWAFRRYAQQLRKTKNVLFYFDFHAHPSTKNFFIYGNSYHDITLQTEVQFFGKLIQSNCPYFQNLESIYSEKQMKSKHKNDNFSKQGCARVFMHRLFNIIHSYTVECGYFGWTKLNHIEDSQKNNFLDTKQLIEDKQFEEIPQRFYSPESYMLMGKGILISILDLFGLNPYSKKDKGHFLSHLEMRKSCGSKIYHENQTFRLSDSCCYKKLNQLSTLIDQIYYSIKLKGTHLKLSTDQSNNILSEQLRYYNASPQTKQKIKMNKINKISSLSKHKSRKHNSYQKVHSQTKIKTLSSKEDLISQKFIKQNKKKILPLLGEKRKKFIHSNQVQDYVNISQKAQHLNFLYHDLQRFNQHDSQLIPLKFNSSQKKIRTQNEILSNRFSLSNSKKDLVDFRLQNNNQYIDIFQQKKLSSSKRQTKIQSKIEQSLILRKGSLSKIVYLKKDDLRLLRITNLLQKKNQRQAIHGLTKKLLPKNSFELLQKDNLPLICGIKKL